MVRGLPLIPRRENLREFRGGAPPALRCRRATQISQATMANIPDPSEHANGRANLHVVIDHARLRKKIEPVVLREVRIPDGDVGQ